MWQLSRSFAHLILLILFFISGYYAALWYIVVV
jgi:hypothetical protein